MEEKQLYEMIPTQERFGKWGEVESECSVRKRWWISVSDGMEKTIQNLPKEDMVQGERAMFHLRSDIERRFYEDPEDLKGFVYNRTEERGDASSLSKAESMKQ